MIRPITDFAASRRGKWITLVLWLLISAIVTPLAPQLADVTTNDQASFLPSGAESTRVADLIKSDFPSAGTPAIIVFRDADGLSERDLTQAKQVSDWLISGAAGNNVHDVISIYTVPQAAEGLQSADQTTMTMVVNVTDEPASDAYTATIERIRDYTSQFDTGRLQVKVSGPGGLLADLLKVFQRIDGFLLLVTGGLVLVLLVLIYRSPVVALLLALLRSNQALGPLLAIAIAVMLLASLTLVPAILTILGRRAFWPFVPHVDHAYEPAERHGVWSRVAGIVAPRPVVVLTSTLVLFVVLALGTFTLRQDFDTLAGLPSGTESRAGFELLRKGFPPGDLAPTEAYVVFPSGASVLDAKNLQAVDAITLALAGRPGISSAGGPSQPLGSAAPVGADRVEAAIHSCPSRHVSVFERLSNPAPVPVRAGQAAKRHRSHRKPTRRFCIRQHCRSSRRPGMLLASA